MDKLQSLVSTYKYAYAREMIYITERKLNKFQPYKGHGSTLMEAPHSGKGQRPGSEKGGGSTLHTPLKRLPSSGGGV